jgi:hypothetical protein
METHRHCLVSRTHLLRMTALTHKTVDDAVKGYELSSREFCSRALNAEKELHVIELSIADRGRTLLAVGKLMDSTSGPGRCSLRIYSALRITHAAATEMARNTYLKIVSGHVKTSAATAEMANLVNGLVRLNTVAVFNRQARHAKTILQVAGERRKYELWHYRVPGDLQELAISRCMEQISEQAFEIADAVMELLEGLQRPWSSLKPKVAELVLG